MAVQAPSGEATLRETLAPPTDGGFLLTWMRQQCKGPTQCWGTETGNKGSAPDETLSEAPQPLAVQGDG